MGNFRKDLARSEEAVFALSEYYRGLGYDVEEHPKATQHLGDIRVKEANGAFRDCEIKFDIMGARTGNLCFEMSNGSKNTGVMTTQATCIYYVVPDRTGKAVFVFNTLRLREWIQDPLNVTIKPGGDKKKFILAICPIEKVRASDILEEEFRLS